MWHEEAWFEINNKYCSIACYKPPNVTLRTSQVWRMENLIYIWMLSCELWASANFLSQNYKSPGLIHPAGYVDLLSIFMIVWAFSEFDVYQVQHCQCFPLFKNSPYHLPDPVRSLLGFSLVWRRQFPGKMWKYLPCCYTGGGWRGGSGLSHRTQSENKTTTATIWYGREALSTL